MIKYVDNLHLCVPKLTIPDLILIITETRRPKYGQVVVYYDHISRALRAIEAFGGPACQTLLRYLEWLFPKISFVPIEHETKIENYPQLHAKALEATTDVILAYIANLEQDPLFSTFQKYMDKESALSFVAKTLGEVTIFPMILALSAFVENTNTGHRAFWLSIYCSAELVEAVIQETGPIDIVVPPSRLRGFISHLAGLGITVELLGLFISAIVRRGVILRSQVRKQQWKVATEFIDHKHIDGLPHHADGIVEGKLVKPSEFLLFLTNRQLMTLRKRHGEQTIKLVEEAVEKRGYHLAVLDELPYPLLQLAECIGLLGRIIMHLVRDVKSSVVSTSIRFVRDYFDFLSLFLWHAPENLLYCTFPNGQTSFRTNAGLVTGLARRNNVTSAGLQTRSIYLQKYEDCFDCFDRYFFWGPHYREALNPAGDLLLERCGVVGSVNIDPNMVDSPMMRTEAKEAEPVSLLAFTGDVHPPGRDFRHHYTYQYNQRFLELLIRFAKENPQVKVQVKLKDKVGLEYFRNDPVIGQYLDTEALSNLYFLPLERDIYRSVLLQADMVTAIGFTSPGTDALLLGKPTVFYSQLGDHTSHFTYISGLVATDDGQFLAMLQRAIELPEQVIDSQRSIVAELDPYRDGLAMQRVASFMMCSSSKSDLRSDRKRDLSK